MNNTFTDRELLVLAELGYFTFSQKMVESDVRSLGELFSEPNIDVMSINDAINELLNLRKNNKISYEDYKLYYLNALKYLSYQLEYKGCLRKGLLESFHLIEKSSIDYAEKVLSPELFGLGAYQVEKNIEELGLNIDVSKLYLSDPSNQTLEGKSISLEEALLLLWEKRNNGSLTYGSEEFYEYIEFYQKYIDFSRFNLSLQLSNMGLDADKCDEYAKKILNEDVFGQYDTHDAYKPSIQAINNRLEEMGLSELEISDIKMFDPNGFDPQHAANYLEDPSLELFRMIVKTRKLNERSANQDASRYNATVELIDCIAHPEKYTDDKSVRWAELAEWEVVDVYDKNDEDGFFAVTIKAGDKMIVSFRGSESFDIPSGVNDWIIADLFLLYKTLTEEQNEASAYMDHLYEKYKDCEYEWYTVGHSLGGNLAEHALLYANDNMNVVNAFSFDGPGMNGEYLKLLSDEQMSRTKDLIHYQWSWVGGLLNPIGDEKRRFIQTADYDEEFTLEYSYSIDFLYKFFDSGFKHNISSFLYRHAPAFVDFDRDGNAIDVVGYDISKDICDELNYLTRYIDNTELFTGNFIGSGLGSGLYTGLRLLLGRERAADIIQELSPDTINVHDIPGTIAVFSKKIQEISETFDVEIDEPEFFDVFRVIYEKCIDEIFSTFYDYNIVGSKTKGNGNNSESSDVSGSSSILFGVDDTYGDLLVGGMMALELFSKVIGYDNAKSASDLLPDLIREGINTKNREYANASRVIVRDPLVIDLGEKGIELTNSDDGVYFDLDNNGFAERSAWIGTEDGFLVLDRNANGSIDNGGELFGDQVWLSDGYVSVSGFDALKDLDSNGDGIIDDNDEAFDGLRIWIDASHDGISQDGELKTLGELGIQSISLEVTRDREVDDETGTLRSESAIVNYTDGTTTKISEFLFNVDTADSVFGEGRVKTIGNIPDIISAIDADESGELSALYESFVNASNPIDKRLAFSEILYKITGASEIEAGSRGGCIDARCLHVIEKFMGREFIGVGGPNPNSEAAKTLNNLYSDIENTYYLKLLMSTDFSHTSNTVFEYTDEDGNKHLDTSVFDLNVMSSIGSNENIDVLLYDMSVFLNSYDNVKGTEYLDEFKRFYSLFSDHYKGLMEIAGYSSTLIDLDKKDLIYGTSNNDYIFGQEGNDTIYAGNGNDVIVGGVGNDILQGSSGNDTYRFNLGDGNDRILDIERGNDGKADRIIFGEGIKKEDVTIDRDGDYLRIKYSDSDSILIQDAYRNIYSDGSAFIENIEFADGTVMNINDINREAAIREGSDENDTMYGYANVLGYDDDEIFHGRGGNDAISAYDGDDTLYGEEGNDNLYAGNGDDTLIGGVGDDLLQGDSGNDTYLFNLGDGNDRILDIERGISGKADRIIFEEGIKKEDLTIDRDGDNLCIKYSDSDSILIQDAYRNIYSDGTAFVENIEFADGTVMNSDEINREAAIRKGSDENDTMYGYASASGYDDDETFYGCGGNDAIYANDGDDTLYGEEGNDYLYAGNGDDTLIGGVGNDRLQGDAGNDTYLINLGDGNDTIFDMERGTGGKADRIVFGEGIKREDLTIDREYDSLRIKYSDSDSILIQDAYKNSYSDGSAHVEYIEFADGTVINLDEINREAAIRIGNDDGNTWYGYASAAGYDDDETFYGRGGNDAIYANDGDDTLYGEEGNDYLYAGNGDDTLIGGVGNDCLQGDAGNDTYLINLGDGNDTIFDMERGNGGKEDRIIFGEGIKREELTIDREGNNLRIKYSDSDNIVIQDAYRDAYSDGSAHVEYIEFADGTFINLDEINREAAIRIGNDDGNTWYGYASASGYDDDETFYGRGGNDAIYANDGDDTLYGEEGNDYLYAGNGDDNLIGGVGNDRLQGDAGNDTYLFNLGDGNDSIYDREVGDGGRADKIVFGEGIKKEDLTINREGDNLRICYSDSDSISILDAYRSNNTDGIAQVEFIEFSDSSVHSINYDTVSLDLVHDAVTEDAEEEVIVDSTETLDEIEELSDEAEVLADVEEITDDTEALAEVVESAVESDETEDDIESMASLANEFMSEQEDEDSVISDESGIMDEIDNMVNLAIQDMSEDASANVGDSDKLFDESSSSDYDQLWVVNE